MHQRLQQLERLVLSLAAPPRAPPRRPSSTSPPAAAAAATASERGIMHASQSHYLGSDHWAAIVDSIAELKEHFHTVEQLRWSDSESPDQPSASPNPNPRTRSLLLYGHGAHCAHEDLIAALPPRPTIDRYISRYFNRQEMISGTSPAPPRPPASDPLPQPSSIARRFYAR